MDDFTSTFPDSKFNEKNFEQSEKEIMDQVINMYAKLSDDQLIAHTHENGTPWSISYPNHAKIPDKLIEKYYKDILKNQKNSK